MIMVILAMGFIASIASSTKLLFWSRLHATCLLWASNRPDLTRCCHSIGTAGEPEACSTNQMKHPDKHVITILLRQKAVFIGTINRKSTRLNSSHFGISYAVFCLKKKNK